MKEPTLSLYKYEDLHEELWMPDVWGDLVRRIGLSGLDFYIKESDLKIIRATGNELKRLVKAGFESLVCDYLELLKE